MALSGRQLEAAALVAADLLGVDDIAQRVGVTRKTLFNWRQLPEFKTRVDEVKAEIRASATITGIALLANRVAALNDRWEMMKAVIRARAADETMTGAGHETGLLVRTYKVVRVLDDPGSPEVDEDLEGQPNGGALLRRRKAGEHTEALEEYAFDAALVKEMREHERQAAQELGQWMEKAEVTQRGTVTIRTITAVQPALAAPSEE